MSEERRHPSGRSAMRFYSLLRRHSRWREYCGYLQEAERAGYAPVSLERWLVQPEKFAGKVLLLRHDVDFDAGSAQLMSQVEKANGITSTFYFRWSTFRPDIVSRIRSAGHQVGLHYETLTRWALENSVHSTRDLSGSVISECRETLRREIGCFKALAGDCASVAGHGDPVAELIGRRNPYLLAGEQYEGYGILASADDAVSRSRIDCSVSDGSGVPSFWWGGVSLREAIAAGHDTVLLNSHPHHWRSGVVILGKRGLRRAVSAFSRDGAYLMPAGACSSDASAWRRWSRRVGEGCQGRVR